jgi:5-methylthioadenosine/S-adenosylhomocysteine deaminase
MSSRIAVDTIIQADWILPMASARPEAPRPNCSLVIHQGRILAVCPQAEAQKRYQAQEVVSLDNHLLMPGLINAHGHAAMSLFRGIADDLPLMTWLQDYIWPLEQAQVTAEFVDLGTRLAMAEMIHSGTTCFSDMYFFPEQAASAVLHAGMRAQIAFPLLDFPTPGAADFETGLHKGLALVDAYPAHPRIKIAFGPHAPYTLCDESLQQVAMLSAEINANVQIHLHETETEISDALAKTGVRPIERLHQLGLLTPRTQCVHMTALTDEDIARVAQTGASVIHCPESNLKLASGLCPVARLSAAGIRVALGTDGAASNNDLDLFGELKTAALLAKWTARDAEALPAYQALYMATLGAAKVLDWDTEIGSLDVGKAADVIAIGLNRWHQQPLHNLASQLVYGNSGSCVTDVWVAGKNLMRNRQLHNINEHRLSQELATWQNRLAIPLSGKQPAKAP